MYCKENNDKENKINYWFCKKVLYKRNVYYVYVNCVDIYFNGYYI